MCLVGSLITHQDLPNRHQRAEFFRIPIEFVAARQEAPASFGTCPPSGATYHLNGTRAGRAYTARVLLNADLLLPQPT